MEQFNNPTFGIQSLTAVINDQPFVPGQVGATGVFEEDGVSTTTVKVESENGTLSLIEPTARGGPGQTIGDDDRGMTSFEVDHYEINDSVKADEVQGVRELGTDDVLETTMGRVEKKLAKHARSMDTTLEHQRVGAIKGIILSGKGRVLHDLYSRFGIPVPAAVALGLSSDVSKLSSLLKSSITLPVEDELDMPFSRLHSFCGADFHAALWEQKEVRETYLFNNSSATLRDGAPDKFEFGNITWERYRTGRRASAAHGGAGFIESNEARIIPIGVPDLFITRFAPADLEETVNTIGLPRYSYQYPMANGKGRHLDSQMNAISLCTRPGALRKVTI